MVSVDIEEKFNEDISGGSLTMPFEFDDDLSRRLVDSITAISTMILSGTSRKDIAKAFVHCLAVVLPETPAFAIEVAADSDVATVLASENSPFAKPGSVLRLADDSVVKRAISEPAIVHRERSIDPGVPIPKSAEFRGDADEVISYRAVPRNETHSIVLAAVSDSDNAARAEAALMSLGDLMVAVCAGHEAVVFRTKSAVDIARAKRQWERTVDALPEIVCLVDQAGDIVRVNRTAEAWQLGDVDRLPGMNVHRMFHEDCSDTHCSLRDAMSLPLAREAANGYLQSAVTDKILGRTLIVHTRWINDVAPNADATHRPCGVVVVSDITASFKANRELADLNINLERHVEQRTAELRNTNRELADEISRRRVAEKDLQLSRDELASLSEQLINAQEAERRRISRELHDSLGQSLGAIKYSLERIAAMHESSKNSEVASELTGVVESVSDTIREARSLAVGLRPPVLDELGIVSALRSLCQNFGNTFSDIEFHVDIAVNNSDVPSHLATPVYRIVQEALNNVVKHASANSVMVALQIDGDRLGLEVLDDGVGFSEQGADTGTFRKLSKFGRLGMRERAVHSNGTFKIESWPGEGTRVTAEWSLKAARIS